MFRHLSLWCFLVAIFVPSAIYAAPKVGKVRDPYNADMGVAAEGAAGCDGIQWAPAEQDNTFRTNHCFKTGKGGSVRLELKGSGNILSIDENSLVKVDEWITPDENNKGSYSIKTSIKNGFMGFKAAKNEGHKASFRTGTAAASIRGTEGVIGGDGNATMFAGLKNGKLAVSDTVTGDSLFVNDGETVIGRKQFVVLKLKSSGDMVFARILMTIIADTTKSLEELAAAAQAADKAYQDSLQALSASLQKDSEQEKEANLAVPQIKYSSYDSLRCVANVAVSNVQKGSEARLSAMMDGTTISEVNVKRNMPKRFKLQSGVHDYEFVVENAVGHNSVKKTLGCYPLKSFSVKVFGDKYVPLQVPPAPPSDPDAGDWILETLQFQIRVPENDPSFLNKVTVRQNGKVILQERLSQIQNLDYQIPVELKRGQKTRFVIEVVHKSGYVVKTSKVYGVKK